MDTEIQPITFRVITTDVTDLPEAKYQVVDQDETVVAHFYKHTAASIACAALNKAVGE